MKIKDIVNRDIVNLTNCEQEPIHIPGSIQTHGFLIAFYTHNMSVDYCSGNINEFLGISHEQYLGKNVSDIFGAELQARFIAYIAEQPHMIKPPMELSINGKDLLCTIYKTDQCYVAEFEPADVTAPDITTVYNQTIQFVSYMEQSATLQQLCSMVADQTRAITGYDRVMIYRFDKDYNGEVFAESKIDEIEPFLGLHYPHTDIPAQARHLYLTNLMRIIVDVKYKPVPIYTIDDAGGKNLDLSRSYLRSVSPIHIEYLQNMGVGGTLTISLIHEGRLWGLITCHHYSEKYVPLYKRIAAQMQGHFLTSQIHVRQINEEYGASAAINACLEQLLNQKHEANAESFNDIVATEALLGLCNASGVAVLFDGNLYTNGKTPNHEAIINLCAWLNTNSKNGEYSTSRLAEVYPDAEKFSATGAGIIYNALSGLHNDCIIWFAPETKEEVHWGGDPTKAIIKNEKGLSPRNSFQLWKEIIKYQGREWNKPELLATSTYAHALQRHITLILISEEEKKQRLLTEQLKEANTELENINWISSHDLKEPLRKIQVFSSKMLERQSSGLSEEAALSLEKVNKSANKMQQLINDITAYNKVRQLHDMFRPVDLNVLMKDVKNELTDEMVEQHVTITYDALPTVSGITLLLKQLFLNLLRNSIKFAREGVKPEISISVSGQPVTIPGHDNAFFYKIDVADNGIGFDNSYSENIFKVFTRLHSVSQYEGSGIGLALCRKIMQNHKGFISASGTLGKGATFSLYFPAPSR